MFTYGKGKNLAINRSAGPPLNRLICEKQRPRIGEVEVFSIGLVTTRRLRVRGLGQDPSATPVSPPLPAPLLLTAPSRLTLMLRLLVVSSLRSCLVIDKAPFAKERITTLTLTVPFIPRNPNPCYQRTRPTRLNGDSVVILIPT